jgi:hypothetical protein
MHGYKEKVVGSCRTPWYFECLARKNLRDCGNGPATFFVNQIVSDVKSICSKSALIKLQSVKKRVGKVSVSNAQLRKNGMKNRNMVDKSRIESVLCLWVRKIVCRK